MSRGYRRESKTGVYHVTTRGINKLAIFKENREKRRILSLIRENLSKYDVTIYAYCIMSNHIHLLIKADIKELASFMAKILAAYAQYYNFKHERSGYVFQNRYKSQCVEDESYFFNCMRYIHLNPAREGGIKTLLKYRYSSFHELHNGNMDIVCENAFIMKEHRFQTPEEFIEFHKRENRDVFEDTKEDVDWNNLRIAHEVLSDMQWNMGLSGEEILEYIDTRKIFEEVLIKSLGASKKTVQDIEKILRKEVKGTG